MARVVTGGLWASVVEPIGASRSDAVKLHAPWFNAHRLVHHARSERGRLAVMVGAGALTLAVAGVVAAHFTETHWPLSRGHPALLGGAAVLSLLGYALKAYGWRQLFARHERPHAVALMAANGGASITALALPGRFDDIVRIGIVRRFRGCPAGVRALCLSLFMLGLIDSAALAPLAVVAAVLPSHSVALRLGMALIAGVGLAAAALLLALPRVTASSKLLRFRLVQWLRPRTTSFRAASLSWGLVSACWITRTLGLVLLLGALGVGFSFTLALLFLCATSAAAALPVGPGGTATQLGAGSAMLVASGVGVPDAVGVAVAVQAVAILVGGSILLSATAWRTGVRLSGRNRTAPSLATG